MAIRLLSRLRHVTTANTQSLRPLSSSLLRHYSAVSPTAPPSTSAHATTFNGGHTVSSKSSVDASEHAKFSAVAETWWDAEGPFKPLHALNPTRLAFIRSSLCNHFRKDPDSIRPFEGLKFIDVGCGGGILSEPLARMGATVTGVDAVDKNIKIARLHAETDPATSSIEYICSTAEKLVEEQRLFDAVIALEVIEHVADPAEFCKSLAALTVDNGATVISTVNRTMRAYASTILIAEYVLHWLPKGTHEWSKFVTPEEVVLLLKRASVNASQMIRSKFSNITMFDAQWFPSAPSLVCSDLVCCVCSFQVQEMAGFVYNPLSGKWLISDDISVNFIALGTKCHSEK